MHRTQIYLQDDVYANLKARSRAVGVSISELIRRSLENDNQRDLAADAREFFIRTPPLESFVTTNPETYVRALRNSSRLLNAPTDDA